ncbi:MAG: imidazolonepropionase [Gammaproteobacteria bacterium]
MFDLVIDNARIYPLEQDLSIMPVRSMAVAKGRIAAFGIPPSAQSRLRLDAHDRVILPGLVDCHTHAVFAGDRLDEYLARLAGADYAGQNRAGGGILSTVAATRRAPFAELLDCSLKHVAPLVAEGVTTLEIKSGYGLDRDSEIKILKVAAAMGPILKTRIVPTFMGAHTVPAQTERVPYLAWVADEMLPDVVASGLARSVDIFVDSIAFTLADLDRLFKRASALYCRLHAHTDQLGHTGATQQAAHWGACSCDHLEYAHPEDVEALAQSGTVAVLLPIASSFLGHAPPPPIEALRQAGVPIAIASDLNPGTAPVASLLWAAATSIRLWGLTPSEALIGITRHAAHALDPDADFGTLAVGQSADFGIWDIPRPESLLYAPASHRPAMSFFRGERR